MPRGFAYKCDYCGDIEFSVVPHYQDAPLPEGWTALISAQVDAREKFLYLCSATCIIGSIEKVVPA